MFHHFMCYQFHTNLLNIKVPYVPYDLFSSLNNICIYRIYKDMNEIRRVNQFKFKFKKKPKVYI